VEEVQMSGRNLVSIDASQNGEREAAAYYYQSASGGSVNYPELALLASIQPIAGQPQQQQQQGSSVQTPVQGTHKYVYIAIVLLKKELRIDGSTRRDRTYKYGLLFAVCRFSRAGPTESNVEIAWCLAKTMRPLVAQYRFI